MLLAVTDDVTRTGVFMCVSVRTQAMKTYHQYHGESLQAENKLRYVESQKLKAEQGAKPGSVSRKARSIEKQADKVPVIIALSARFCVLVVGGVSKSIVKPRYTRTLNRCVFTRKKLCAKENDHQTT